MTTAAPRRPQATPEGFGQGYGTDDMFFLLRVAFWLTIVLALLPSGGAQQSAQAKVGIGQRAQAGARMVYDFISDHASHSGETGSVNKPKQEPRLASVRTVPASQSTLKDSDLEAVWQGPPARTENVPLPRNAPHRKT